MKIEVIRIIGKIGDLRKTIKLSKVIDTSELNEYRKKIKQKYGFLECKFSYREVEEVKLLDFKCNECGKTWFVWSDTVKPTDEGWEKISPCCGKLCLLQF